MSGSHFVLVLLICLRVVLSVEGSYRSNMPLAFFVRGGAHLQETDTPNDHNDERYSRQTYTLGNRAMKLIRSSTVYLDGPPASGLLWETAKNLALSGIRRIVLVQNDSSKDSGYLDARLDDLGRAYRRAARAELQDDVADDATLLTEYLRRLNPSVRVETTNELPQSDEPQNGVLLCVDRPEHDQYARNDRARELGLKFVAVETAGVYGRVVCDFGDNFCVFDGDGETPLVTPFARATPTEDGGVLVETLEGEKHDVSRGDLITFQLQNGSEMEQRYTVREVLTPFRFVIEAANDDSDMDHVNEQARSLSRVKVPQIMQFRPMRDAIRDSALQSPSDFEKSFDADRSRVLGAAFCAMGDFVTAYGELPSQDNSEELEALILAAVEKEDEINAQIESHAKSFARICRAKFAPLQAVFGAIAAQEALKGVTGLYNPIQQYLYFDCDEVLPSAVHASGNGIHAESGMQYIFGDDLIEVIQSKRIFVVGAGAIGCELLKNLSAMGACVSPDGKIVVTDMDTIERSNLSRQLLFHDSDIGMAKSEAASDAVLRLNPSVSIEHHSSKVGGDEPGPFDEQFWTKKIDIVLNALDNMEARLHIDGKCVAHALPLIDAGTMGAKGNVQVVVPFESESYASSTDPPESSIPVCTLKNFPYMISHTIQWARDTFDGLFRARASQMNEFLQSAATLSITECYNSLASNVSEEAAKQMLEELREDSRDLTRGAEAKATAIEWSLRLIKHYFVDDVKKLLNDHPLDSVDEDGNPFWSGSRRPPQILRFGDERLSAHNRNAMNENMISFLQSATRLRCESLYGEVNRVSEDEARAALETAFSSATNIITDGTCLEPQQTLCSMEDDVSFLLHEPARMTEANFEKDDETNDHIAFITAASNLRALVYGIPPVDFSETRRVAGRIVPAMITTTAMVSGLSCIELVKSAQKLKLPQYRNAFINLALPFFAFTAPLPAERQPGLQGRHYTLWDRIDVRSHVKDGKAKPMTLKRLLRYIRNQAAVNPQSVSVSSVSFGPYLLYADFLHEDDKATLKSTLWDLIETSVSEDDGEGRDDAESMDMEYSKTQSFVDLTVVVTDLESSDEVELPPVRVHRS